MTANRVNFFLVSPPKSGTTSFADYLGQHPEIQVSRPKEPNYFSYAGGNPYGWPLEKGVTDIERYHGLFNFRRGKGIYADASTFYIYGEQCATAIREYNRNAKIAVILRDPVERAYSMFRYWHQTSGTWDQISHENFEHAFNQDDLITPAEPPPYAHKPVFWLKDMGYYGRMLESYYSEFSFDQIMIIKYEDLLIRPTEIVQDTFRFLGVDEHYMPNMKRLNKTIRPRVPGLDRWINGQSSGPIRHRIKRLTSLIGIGKKLKVLVNLANRLDVADDLPADMHARLIEVYRDDIALLTKLTRRDFSYWLDSRLRQV